MKQKKMFLYLITSLLLVSCSKDRLEIRNLANEKYIFSTDDTIFNGLTDASQKITIKSGNDFPIVGIKGTLLYLNINDLKTLDGSTITYPFDVEFLEIITPKDFILNRLPTVSGNRLLETDGSFYVNATKDGKQLNASLFQIERPVKNPDAEMKLFQQDFQEQPSLTNRPINWVLGDSTQRGRFFISTGLEQNSIPTIYFAFPSNLGWWNIDKFLNFDKETTEVAFQSISPELESLQIYLFFYDYNSIMRIYGGKSFPVPIGSKIRVLAFAKTEEGDFYGFFEDYKLDREQTIKIIVAPSTEAEILKELDKLKFN